MIRQTIFFKDSINGMETDSIIITHFIMYNDRLRNIISFSARSCQEIQFDCRVVELILVLQGKMLLEYKESRSTPDVNYNHFLHMCVCVLVNDWYAQRFTNRGNF